MTLRAGLVKTALGCGCTNHIRTNTEGETQLLLPQAGKMLTIKNNSMQSGRGFHLGKNQRAEKIPNVEARGSLGTKTKIYQVLSTSDDVGGRSAIWQLLEPGFRTLRRHPDTPALALSKEAITR